MAYLCQLIERYVVRATSNLRAHSPVNCMQYALACITSLNYVFILERLILPGLQMKEYG